MKRVVFFHCDHFEPFQKDSEGNIISLSHIEEFLKKLTQYPWGSPSLFFSSQAYYLAQNKFWSGSRKKEDEEIQELLKSANIDFQVHIHHEGWLNEVPSSPEINAQRLDEMLKLIIPKDKTEWCFIHGCWALQASDATICNISNEVKVLLDNGCIADFTFPAGRPWCNPELTVPHTVLPVNMVKGYITKFADPIPVAEAKVFEGRLLIWASNLSAQASSLDHVAMGTISPQQAACSWINSNTIIDDTLYIKTHAHSLQDKYWQNPNSEKTPLLSSNVISAIRILENMCNAQGIGLEYGTASSVMKELKQTKQ